MGEDRAALLTHISADGAEWIHTVATERAPQAVLCLDAFHVVAWATTALDAVRRGTWNQLRRDGKTDQAKALKNSRWALLKNPPDLRRPTHHRGHDRQDQPPALPRLPAQEQLREVFHSKAPKGKQLLTGWLSWASRSRLPEFVALAKRSNGSSR